MTAPTTYDLVRAARDIVGRILDAQDDDPIADLDDAFPAIVAEGEAWRVAADAKAAGIAIVYRALHAEADHLADEAERLTQRAERLRREGERVAGYGHELCLAAEQLFGAPKAGALRLQYGPGRLVGGADPATWPADYVVEVPATYRLDKAAIKAAIAEGASVEGFHVERGRSLRGLS